MLCATSFMECAVSAQSLPNPIAHWKLDGNANDSVGTINGAANGISWVQSEINGQQKTVANFDGTGSIALTGELAALKLGLTFSVSTWVNVSNWSFTGGNAYYGIFCAGQPMVSWPSNWPNAAYGFAINPDRNLVSVNGRSDYPEYTLAASYTTQSITTPGDFSNESLDLGIATDTWRMLTWTYDGSELKSYLDTTLLTVFDSYYGYGNHFIGRYGTTNDISPYTNFTNAWIGRDSNEAQAGAADNPVQNFNGLMSDLTIYDVTLQPDEINTLYTVPEPSTYALLLLSGAASLWALKRRKS